MVKTIIIRLGAIFAASRDMNISKWCSNSGVMLDKVKAHSHWINSIVTNTDTIKSYGYELPGICTTKFNTNKESYQYHIDNV